jgi:transcriptional regulator with GAF, ATPase, and Fis domain
VKKDIAQNRVRQETIRLKETEKIEPTYADRLLRFIDEADQKRTELEAFIKSSRAVLEQKGFKKTARAIFDHCKEVIGAASGYVALLSETGEENEVLFLESGGLSCTVNPDLPMPIRGLRANAYQEKKAVYDNAFMNSKWVKFLPKGHVELKNVLFAPLILDEKVVGLIGLANKEADFDDNDAKMATNFGSLAAIALQNSRNLDRRDEAEAAREALIAELKEALEKVNTLSGMLPICAHCKKVRDDHGYWNQIESYIRNHSQAEFTHGICPECATEHFPDLNVYESGND